MVRNREEPVADRSLNWLKHSSLSRILEHVGSNSSSFLPALVESRNGERQEWVSEISQGILEQGLKEHTKLMYGPLPLTGMCWKEHPRSTG